MIDDIEIKKKLTSSWFSFLQNEICNLFESIENQKSNNNCKKFIKRDWVKSSKKEGGGISYLLTNGKIFDKVGVNYSEVSGFFKKEYRKKVFGAGKDGKYWASGISIVAHMKNPKIPALHFNTRFIVTKNSWFGGGMDATPCIRDDLEEKEIHKALKSICFQNKKNYNKYKIWCDKYFYLPHRKESRGIGGVFFDYETGNWEDNFKFIRELGLCFMNISKKIIMNKKNFKWSKKEKEKQFIKRGKYVEFNLLYDRGTKFGLNSGGNLESILMSLPPKPMWK